MEITIKILKFTNDRGRDLFQAMGYLPSGQLLIQGAIREGRDTTGELVAKYEICNWIRDNRPGYTTVCP